MPRYNELVVAATHNSYSPGERGSIPHQLDAGVRFIELDIHDNGIETLHDYRLGHLKPGAEVAHGGGNPTTDMLSDWLQVIAGWSARKRPHVPIVVMLDLKDPFTDNRSYAGGNFARLNDIVDGCLPMLFTPEELGNWPEHLEGRVIVVLSGDAPSRRAYVRDTGHNPAVAVTAGGRIVEVHDSGTGDLWYWTGEFVSPTSVRWHRHGWYDTGRSPAIAMDDAGRIVEVHMDPTDSQLWYRVGQLGPDFELSWTAVGGRPFPHDDPGISPSVRFVGANAVREVHRGTSSGRWYWNGALAGGKVNWTRSDSGRTNDPQFPKAQAAAGGRSIIVSTASNGAFGGDTLLYAAGGGGVQRIRYRQRCFTEVQPGDDVLSRDGLWFFAGPAGDAAWAARWRRQGKLVRLWDFDEVVRTDPPVNYAATNHPDAQWYRDYLASVGAVS